MIYGFMWRDFVEQAQLLGALRNVHLAVRVQEKEAMVGTLNTD